MSDFLQQLDWGNLVFIALLWTVGLAIAAAHISNVRRLRFARAEVIRNAQVMVSRWVVLPGAQSSAPEARAHPLLQALEQTLQGPRPQTPRALQRFVDELEVRAVAATEHPYSRRLCSWVRVVMSVSPVLGLAGTVVGVASALGGMQVPGDFAGLGPKFGLSLATTGAALLPLIVCSVAYYAIPLQPVLDEEEWVVDRLLQMVETSGRSVLDAETPREPAVIVNADRAVRTNTTPPSEPRVSGEGA